MDARQKTAGLWTFGTLSVALWGLAAWLLAQAGGEERQRLFGYVAAFAALVLSSHTILFALFAGRKEREQAWLRAHGRPLEAVVSKVDRRGHAGEWRVKARRTEQASGGEIRYRSRALRAQPDVQVGDRVRVYVDPANPRRYWMDVGVEDRYL